MTDVEFHAHEMLTGKPLGTLDPKSFAFNDPVWGAGGLEMMFAIPTGKRVSALKNRTQTKDRVQVFALKDDTFLGGFIINFRSRQPGGTELKVKAQSWKAWLYNRHPITTTWLRTREQYAMAAELWAAAGVGTGTPTMMPAVAATTGTTRAYTIEAYTSIGKALDDIALMDGGFEWSIGYRYSRSTGLPEMFLERWAIGQQRSRSAMLFLDQQTSRNRVAVGEIPEDATEYRSSVIATGEGGVEVEKSARDDDPELASGVMLRREEVMNYGETKSQNLFDNARGERIRRQLPYSTIPVDHDANLPNVSSYRPGDRARLRVRDDWDDIDVSGVRITDRVVRKESGGLLMATVTLDLTDVSEVD